MKSEGILIVDDDPIVCRAIKEQLIDEGYHVSTASGGKKAWSLCKGKKFGLAYINLIMDPIDGVETAKKLRQIRPQMKIVLMSGFHEELQIRAREASKVGMCEAILDKPILIDIVRFTKRLLRGGLRKNGKT